MDLTRRGFLRGAAVALTGGVVAAELEKSYFFLGGILRPRGVHTFDQEVLLPENVKLQKWRIDSYSPLGVLGLGPTLRVEVADMDELMQRVRYSDVKGFYVLPSS